MVVENLLLENTSLLICRIFFSQDELFEKYFHTPIWHILAFIVHKFYNNTSFSNVMSVINGIHISSSFRPQQNLIFMHCNFLNKKIPQYILANGVRFINIFSRMYMQGNLLEYMTLLSLHGLGFIHNSRDERFVELRFSRTC